MRELHIIYQAGKDNAGADALSQSPQAPAQLEELGESEVQVSSLTVRVMTEQLLKMELSIVL